MKSQYGLRAHSGATSVCTSRKENELRKALAYGEIDREMFDQMMENLRVFGELTRDGRVIGRKNKWEAS